MTAVTVMTAVAAVAAVTAVAAVAAVVAGSLLAGSGRGPPHTSAICAL